MEGHREAVVAGARRHHAAATLGGVELEQEVGGAALLERAGHLEVLELEVTALPLSSESVCEYGQGVS